ncbi:MAG: EFR1 family ferrodoxin [Lachnospiraceae bacterium]|nr:EFR1 family ferrodoxin [Lachnospiraceae bacterium]
MVLYFSATGNTEYVAKTIANLLNDDSMNLLNRIKKADYSEIHSDSPFIICAPIYVCEMPRFFADYLKKLKLSGNKKAYFIFTSGGYAGIASTLAKKIIKKKGMEYMGRAEYKMPRNYPMSHYEMLTDEENLERIKDSKAKIYDTVKAIKKGEKLKARHIFLFELIITLPFNPIWVKYKQPAKPFYTTDACIGCGKCEKLCPLNNISIVDKKPKWHSACAHCMACYANCPTEAIEYADKTQGKNRYRLNKYIKG